MRAVETMSACADLKTKLQFPKFQRSLVSHLIQSRTTFDAGTRRHNIDAARLYVNILTKVMPDIPLYFVKREMTDLIQHAANQLSDEDVVDRTIAPTKSGFVYFEKPIEGVDLRGQNIKLNACVWFFDASGTLCLYMFNDMYRTPDKPSQDILNDKKAMKVHEELQAGRWSFIGMEGDVAGAAIGAPLNEQDEVVKTFYEEVEGFTPTASTNFIRAIHAFWLIMGQTLVSITEEVGDKRFARTQAQMKLPNLVQVIQYRRTENMNEYSGESNVEWSHRWIVRGHWRWQPFKNEAGKDDRKRIWIAPFMKGPEDKPLVLTDKIYALTR